MVAGIWNARQPDRIDRAAVGKRRVFPRELPELPMLQDTVFDLASLTKIMGTATLAATLVDRKWIQWDTPLQAILSGACYPEVTLGHLLSHTAGFAAWAPLWETMREHFGERTLHHVPVAERQRMMRELVLKIMPEVAPGERAVYSDISILATRVCFGRSGGDEA